MRSELQSIAQFADRSPFIYVEHFRVEQHELSIALHGIDGYIPLPVCGVACLLLGPGSSITHQAVINAVEGGCTLFWTGEQGIRFYAAGHHVYGKSKNMSRQAICYADQTKRDQMARQIYQRMFQEIIPASHTIEQIRGMEGARVRTAYRNLSQEYGIPWTGRRYDRTNWDNTNPLNRAITSVNVCLYGICTAALISLGYAPELGFIHHGFATAFACDIADLYKVREFFPIAFRCTAEGTNDLDRKVRYACRDYIRETNFMKRVVKDIGDLFDDYSDT